MTHFQYVHDFTCEPAQFWRVFFDEPFNVALHERIQVKERRMLERKEDDATIHWSVRIMPQRDLPGIIKKIVGGDLGYVETSTYYKGKDYIDVKIEPTLLKDRTKIRALYTLKELGGGKVRRTYEGDIEVDLPLVGRRIEAAVLQDVKRSYEVAAQVTAEWLAKGGV